MIWTAGDMGYNGQYTTTYIHILVQVSMKRMSAYVRIVGYEQYQTVWSWGWISNSLVTGDVDTTHIICAQLPQPTNKVI